jgi:hypothetical protein
LAERLAAISGDLTLGDLWLELQGVVTWTGGSCGYALDALRPLLADETNIYEAGYQASECIGTVNVSPDLNLCLPALEATFFEFVSLEDREAGRMHFHDLSTIDVGSDYYVYVTTANGLYRYDMNDIVRVSGRFRATPTFEFVRKGQGFTNIVGEKLSEQQAIRAVRTLFADMPGVAPFFLLLADEHAMRYRLAVESDADCLPDGVAELFDAALVAANIEYRDKRASGRLRAPEVLRPRAGAAEAYREILLGRGQRDSRFKVQHLQTRSALGTDLDGLLVGRAI